MTAVQRRLRYEHVTGQAAEAGAAPLLQNHYCVLHMAVQEVDMEVGAHCYPLLAAPHWTLSGPGRSREGDPM